MYICAACKLEMCCHGFMLQRSGHLTGWLELGLSVKSLMVLLLVSLTKGILSASLMLTGSEECGLLD